MPQAPISIGFQDLGKASFPHSNKTSHIERTALPHHSHNIRQPTTNPRYPTANPTHLDLSLTPHNASQPIRRPRSLAPHGPVAGPGTADAAAAAPSGDDVCPDGSGRPRPGATCGARCLPGARTLRPDGQHRSVSLSPTLPRLSLPRHKANKSLSLLAAVSLLALPSATPSAVSSLEVRPPRSPSSSNKRCSSNSSRATTRGATTARERRSSSQSAWMSRAATCRSAGGIWSSSRPARPLRASTRWCLGKEERERWLHTHAVYSSHGVAQGFLLGRDVDGWRYIGSGRTTHHQYIKARQKITSSTTGIGNGIAGFVVLH